MMNTVDLKELMQRESERVEWKENVADIEDILQTAVAFANDYSNLGGGYIVCGAKEGKDEHGFQKLIAQGLTSSRLKEIEGKFLSDLREKVVPPVVSLTEEIIVNEEKRILVFIIPATSQTHSYRASGKDSSKYYIRIGRETREAKNGLLRELLIQKKDIEPWDKRINTHSDMSDIDLILLREYLQEMKVWDSNKSSDDYLDPKQRISSFVPSLVAKEAITNKLKPRNFTILMFCNDPLKFIDGAYTVFSIYKGKDRSEPIAEKHEITGSIVQQAKKCIELLNAESYTAFNKEDNIPNQLKYPVRALQEAVVNSLVHRDYEINQPARVTVFIDRIEIYSPGAIPRVIDKDKFLQGRSTPYWRNQSLAYFFNKLQLAQAEGQGIPTIFRTMKEEGCPAPIFELERENLTCILPAHPRHFLIREIAEIENDIIFGKNQKAEMRLKGILDKDPYNFRAIDLYCQVSNLLNQPKNVLTFIVKNNIDFSKLNSNTIINITETFSLLESDNQIDKIINDLIQYSRTLSLEEKEIERMVISLNKLRKTEELIKFVDESIRGNQSLIGNVVLLENRARAKIDLAKQCIKTGKNYRRFKKNIRAKAWEKARQYLAEAEHDLNLALENASSPIDRDYIEKDYAFLRQMKKNAVKPE
ncbi:MAG: putative DNA binding domain-containing protein [Spirochaetales bacterium]|nr:putative DNA binding domain-containing protein [Spirochaetales bacterium]